jgi:polysaccharide pyruvyl transferase CsaB
VIWLAKLMNKKCVLYANGIGPIKRNINRKWTKRIVNKVDLITLREHLSKEELKRLGITKPEIVVTADPVFNLAYKEVDARAILAKEGVDQSKPLISVFFRSWEGQEQYVTKMATICDYICNQYDMNVLLIPMKYPDDVAVSRAICDKMKNNAFVLNHRYDAETLISLIGQTQLVLSMRLHAIIYAALINVPMIGFEYDPKVKYFIKELDMVLAGNIKSFKENEVMNQIDTIFENYSQIQEKLKKRVSKIKEKASENIKLFNQV